MNILDKLKQSGELKNLYQLGVISSKVSFYLDLVEKYKEYRALGKIKSQAVTMTAEIARTSDRTVMRAIDLYKKAESLCE